LAKHAHSHAYTQCDTDNHSDADTKCDADCHTNIYTEASSYSAASSHAAPLKKSTRNPFLIRVLWIWVLAGELIVLVGIFLTLLATPGERRTPRNSSVTFRQRLAAVADTKIVLADGHQQRSRRETCANFQNLKRTVDVPKCPVAVMAAWRVEISRVI
jgi:hypothetical protein